MRAGALTVGAVMAAVLLAGCGGGTGDGGSKSPRPKGGSASATSAKETRLSRGTVRRNVRAAAAAGGFDRVVDRAGTPARCRVIAAVPTDDVPKAAALAKVVADLKGRGWEQVFRKPEAGGVTWLFTKANWGLYVFTTAPSKEDPDGPRFTFSGQRLDCPNAPATASP
ncbi:hypothetical protein ACFWCA_06980 [Streptomyces phaeochromogenes]|uniref:hypothetical protein n=1 Tax=Streptomyces phaeochromogenes TaxID=1923 RepID=UPI00367CF6A5